MKNNPSKKELIELYVDKRLTTYEIAELYSVHRRSVNRWFKKYGITIVPTQRKYEHIKKIPLTKQQKEMIVGVLLGDAFVGEHGRKNKSCRLHIGHCEKQKELVYHQKSILGNLVNVVNRKVDKRDGSIMLGFVTVTHNDFRFFRKLFYQGNLKIIRPEIVNYITEYSLAHWIMDDGSSDGKYSIRLHTQGFTKDENERLQEILKAKFDLRCKVCASSRNGKIYYYLSFNKRNSMILSDLVRDYIIDSMKYKILPSPND